jgi:hypothetical protein
MVCSPFLKLGSAKPVTDCARGAAGLDGIAGYNRPRLGPEVVTEQALSLNEYAGERRC